MDLKLLYAHLLVEVKGNIAIECPRAHVEIVLVLAIAFRITSCNGHGCIVVTKAIDTLQLDLCGAKHTVALEAYEVVIYILATLIILIPHPEAFHFCHSQLIGNLAIDECAVRVDGIICWAKGIQCGTVFLIIRIHIF